VDKTDQTLQEAKKRLASYKAQAREEARKKEARQAKLTKKINQAKQTQRAKDEKQKNLSAQNSPEQSKLKKRRNRTVRFVVAAVVLAGFVALTGFTGSEAEKRLNNIIDEREIILSAIEKNPEHRFKSMSELADIKKEKQDVLAEYIKIYDEGKNKLDGYGANLLAIQSSIDGYKEEIAGIAIEIEELEKLLNVYDTSYQIKNFKTVSQKPDYPTGCESVALYMLLKYHGVEVTIEQIVEELPKGRAPYYKNGVMYGGNPEIEFIGDPRDEKSFGVYDKPIADIANNYKSHAVNVRGKKLDELLPLVKLDRPILVWVSIALTPPYTSHQWIYEPTGETIDWPWLLHAVVIVGFTENRIIVADPMPGTIVSYDRKTFEYTYDYYGRRAIYY